MRIVHFSDVHIGVENYGKTDPETGLSTRLTDFLETILVAALATTLFFGGWQIPYLTPEGFVFPWGAELAVSNLVYVLLGVTSFSVKILVFCFLFMQLRWTLPRFRYDQLMALGWKGLFPIALANVVVTAVVLLFVGEAN